MAAPAQLVLSEQPLPLSTWPLDDVRSLTASCVEKGVWRSYDHYPQIPRAPDTDFSLDRWLDVVRHALVDDPACHWVEIQVDYGRIHNKTEIYIPSTRTGVEGDEQSAQESPPDGVVLSWETVVDVLMDSKWPSSGASRPVVDRSAVQGSILPLDTFAELEKLQVRCDFLFTALSANQDCASRFWGADMPTVEIWLSKMRSQYNKGTCDFLKVTFTAHGGALLGTPIYLGMRGIGQADASTRDGVLIDWQAFKAAMRATEWPSCPSTLLPEATTIAPSQVAGSISPPPTGTAVPPHFTWAPTEYGLLAREKPWHAFVIAECPSRPLRLQPSYRGYPRLEEPPSVSVGDWLVSVISCVRRASEEKKDWVVVSFWWEESQDGHSELLRQGEVFVVTDHWDAKGKDERPIPPGQRIRLNDFVKAMRKMPWQGQSSGRKPITPPSTTDVARPGQIANAMSFITSERFGTVDPVTGKHLPPSLWIDSSDDFFSTGIPEHAYVEAQVYGQTYRLQRNKVTEVHRGLTVIREVDQWLSALKVADRRPELPMDWVHVKFWWKDDHGQGKLQLPMVLYVATGRQGASPESCAIAAGYCVRWDDFVLGMRKMPWYPDSLTTSTPAPTSLVVPPTGRWVLPTDYPLRTPLPCDAFLEIGLPTHSIRRSPFRTYSSEWFMEWWIRQLEVYAETVPGLDHVTIKIGRELRISPNVHSFTVETLWSQTVATKYGERRIDELGQAPPGLWIRWDDFVSFAQMLQWEPTPKNASMTSGPASHPGKAVPANRSSSSYYAPPRRTPTNAKERILAVLDRYAKSMGMTRGWFLMLSSILALQLVAIYLLARILRQARRVSFRVVDPAVNEKQTERV